MTKGRVFIFMTTYAFHSFIFPMGYVGYDLGVYIK